MPEEVDLKRVAALVDQLESEDAFERRQAIEALAVFTQQRLDFRWTASPEERAAAVERWRKWLKRERRRRQGKDVQATIQILSGGAISQAALEKALEHLPPKQKQALIAQVLAKVTQGSMQSPGAHPPCEVCAKRPATVKITTRAPDGQYVQQALCEVCAAGS